jgi:hypothetical protein
MATLVSVSRLVSRARKIGTPEPVVMASVLAKREVFRLRSNLPYSGAVSSQVCQRVYSATLRSARRQLTQAPISSSTTITP